MRLFRRAPKPPAAAPPPPPAPSLWERVLFWKAELRREVQAAPSVDETQQRDAQAQWHRLDAGTDVIAKAIAEQGVWFPHDGPPRNPWD